MTRADDIRHQVLTLDANGLPAAHIAHALGIPTARVDTILDNHDAAQGVPHADRVRAPVLEPLGGPPVINSKAAVAGGSDTARDPMRPKRIPRKDTRKRTRPPAEGERKPSGGQWKDDIECGTVRGYNRHKRLKEQACRPCTDAYVADDQIKRPRKPPPPPIECGTIRGYNRHRRRRETVCDACYVANRGYERGTRQTPIPHGTPEGYLRHRRIKEKPCDACQPYGNLTHEAVYQERFLLHQKGMTDRQIAEAVGLSRAVIAKWRARHGLPVNRRAS